MPGDFRKRPRDGGVAGIHNFSQYQSVSDRQHVQSKHGSLMPKYSISSVPPNLKRDNQRQEAYRNSMQMFAQGKKIAMKNFNQQNDLEQSQMSMLSKKNQIKTAPSWQQNGTFLPPNQGVSGDQLKSQLNIMSGNQENQQEQEKKFQDTDSQSEICQYQQSKEASSTKRYDYNMQNLELCFRIDIITNNGQQKISIERGISQFAQLDNTLHKIINIQSYPASIVSKLPELADVNKSITALQWNQTLQSYLLALVKKQEFFIPQLFKFLGLAVINNPQSHSFGKSFNQSMFRKLQPKKMPSKTPSKIQQPSSKLANILQTQQSNHLSPSDSRKQSDQVSNLNKRSLTAFSPQRKLSSQSQNLHFNKKRKSLGTKLRQNTATQNRLIEFLTLQAIDYQFNPKAENKNQIQNFIFKFKICEMQAKKWVIQKKMEDFYALRRQLAESLQKPLSQIPPLPYTPQFSSKSSRIIIPLMRGLEAFLMELMSNGYYSREPLLIFLQYTSRISHISSK